MRLDEPTRLAERRAALAAAETMAMRKKWWKVKLKGLQGCECRGPRRKRPAVSSVTFVGLEALSHVSEQAAVRAGVRSVQPGLLPSKSMRHRLSNARPRSSLFPSPSTLHSPHQLISMPRSS